jgi:LmbE family N-acetylglucosaminyl deacetylase
MSPARRQVEAALVPLKLPLASHRGNALRRRATDVTATTAGRSCLVVAPHPDDETIGCGATIMRKLDAGTAVAVLVLSDGATWPPDHTAAENMAIRHAEVQQACALLGVADDALTHLSFPETRLDDVVDDLVDAITDAVAAHRPDDVFVTSEADPHADHAAVGRAARRAVAGTGARLVAYPIWQWTRPRSWTRTLAAASPPEAVATDGYLERKTTAVAVFRSQLTGAGLGVRQGMTPAFIDHFLASREMFFPVPLP